MKKIIAQHKDFLITLITCLALFWGIFIIYILFETASFSNEQEAAENIMRILLLCLAGIALFLLLSHKARIPHLLLLLLAAGIIMRIGYTLYTPYYVRSHDLGTVTDVTSRGHANYIYTIYETLALPDNNEQQFYQPPLFHIAAALVMKLYHFFFPTASATELMDTTKLVSCFASVCTLLTMKKILEELECSFAGTILSFAIVSFFPNYFLTAGRVNNDSLAFLFLVLSLLYTLRWGKRHQKKDLFALSCFIGLGMMTKLSVAVVAFLAGPLMLYWLWKQCRCGNAIKTIAEYAVFLFICVPLGLWYSVRNLLLFGQPIGYVLDITATYGETTLYRGNLSLTERFLSLPWHDLQLRPFIDVNTDSNVNTYLLRNSLFGEFSFSGMENFAHIFILVNAILILLSLLSAVYVLIFQKKNNWVRFAPALTWLLTMVSYYSFNLKYPESCTMDYRYILIAAFCGSIYIGECFSLFWKRYVKAKQEKENLLQLSSLTGVLLLAGISTLFILLSVSFYTTISA